MPALPPVVKTIRVDLLQTLGPNTRIQDRLFFTYTGSVSLNDLTTVLTTIRNSWNTNIAPNLVGTHTLNSVRGTDLNSNTGAQTIVNVPSQGTSAAQFQSASTAMVVRFKVSLRYRGGHPRFYLPGIGATSLQNVTQWNAATQTAIQSNFSSFIAGCILNPPAAVGVLAHASVSYFSGFHNVTFPSGRVRSVPTLRVTPVINPVTAYSVNPNVGTQRRRDQQSI